MQTVSGFGFTAPDPFGEAMDIGLSNWRGNLKGKQQLKFARRHAELQYKYATKLMNFQSDLNRQNQMWAAENMPSETVTGLRRASLNPLLAFSDFSGLSSSGAMGVSPSSIGSSIPSVDSSSSSGHSGFDPQGLDSALDFFGSGKNRRENKLKSEKLASNQLDTAFDVSDVDNENKAALAQANYNSALAEAAAKTTEASNRSKQAELKSYLLNREAEAVTGMIQPDRGTLQSRGTDEQNEFWTDYYRNKLDLDKWKNSAYRQYLLDGVEVGDAILNGIGTIGKLKGAKGSKGAKGGYKLPRKYQKYKRHFKK